MKGLIITTDNIIRTKDFSEPAYKSVGEAVGGYIEIVHPKRLNSPYCMVVNDEGLLIGLPPNLHGSYLYCTDQHGSPIPLIIQCGIDLLVSLIGALPDIIVALVQAMPTIISSIITALLDNIPLIIQCGIDLLVSLVKSLPEIITTLVSKMPEIISSMVSALADGVSSFAEIGVNLVEGLWSGIQSLAGWLWDKVSGWISSIWDGICDFFGIASPSKLFKNMLGRNLMLGLAEGIAAEAETAIGAMEDVAEEIADVDFSTQTPDVPDPDNVD